jgi:hypothetical protein
LLKLSLECSLVSCARRYIAVSGVSFDGTSRQFEEQGPSGPPGALPALNKYIDHFFKEFEGVDKFVRLSGNMFCKEVESFFCEFHSL